MRGSPIPVAWDPSRYLTYAGERARPFVELLARIAPEDPPASVVDLGCGPGNLTSLLADRWPSAHILGVDSSPDMVDAARARGDGRVRFEHGDLLTWRPVAQVDVVVCNAALHWVPGHLDLLPALVRAVRPGGWLALQVPANMREPSHALRRELAAEPPYAAHTAHASEPDAHDAAKYWRALATLGCTVDAWETTYLHVLPGEDAVFEWIAGTSARPILAALSDELRPGFEDELKRRLRAAYPQTQHGTLLPFRRVFAVAKVPGEPA